MEWLIVMGVVLFVGYYLGKSGNNKTGKIERSTELVRPNSAPKKLNIRQVEIESIKLSDEQTEIYNLLETTNNAYYITGKAGTGKSILLRYFVANTGKRVVVVAPTGVAALNIGGQTIHSLFKMPFDIDFNDIKVDYKTRELLRNIDTVVIDEVSMVRADLMEAINIKLQIARGNAMPFGDVQMIMFGDLYQLPPVVSDGELQRYLNHKFGGHYFFNAPSTSKAKLQTYELKKVFRQKDAEFIRILDSVRRGVIKEDDLETLNERTYVEKPSNGYITLAGTNETVSYINHKNLDKLPGEEMIYEAEIWGDITENSFPTEKKLRLKIGAQVMMLKNDIEKPRRWVNGTLGVITKLSQDVVRVNIDGVEHTITPTNWDKIQYEYDPDNRELNKKVVSSFKQLPLRLAWAITIHKSQGQTYKTIAIDLTGGAFAHGQTYVALSRCVSLEGIYLNAPIKKDDIIVDPDIIEFMSKAVVLN